MEGRFDGKKYVPDVASNSSTPISFSEMEIKGTVALDSGAGGTRRACNNENCLKDYGHKDQCSPTPAPEPREPAREVVEEKAKKAFAHNFKGLDYSHLGRKELAIDFAVNFALAYSAELRAERDTLLQADIQRAKDITRLTIERDRALEKLAELRINANDPLANG